MTIRRVNVGLVPGRDCGGCNVCCVAPAIDHPPELQKLNGIRCQHNGCDNLCAIYETRPEPCRAFHCGYRQLEWIQETLKPSRSGVFVHLRHERTGSRAEGKIGVLFTILDATALDAEGLAESVAAGVREDQPIYLGVPGPPGFASAVARLNEAVEIAVVMKNMPEIRRILHEAYADLDGDAREPLTLRSSTGGVAEPPVV